MSSSTGGKPPSKSSAKAKNDHRKANQQQQAQELAKLRSEVAQLQKEKALLQQLQRDKELQNVSTSSITPSSASSVPVTQVSVPKTKKSTASDPGQHKENSSQGTSVKPKPVVSPSSPQKGNSSQGTSTVTEKAHNKTSGRSLSTQDFNQIKAGYSSEINALMSSLDLGMRATLKELFKSELRSSDQIYLKTLRGLL